MITADAAALRLATYRARLAKGRTVSRTRSAALVLRGLALGQYRAAWRAITCELEMSYLRAVMRGALIVGRWQVWRLRRAERREGA